jgi:hypothetical protein
MLRVDTSEITDTHLDQFAAVDLNGRQIKNAVEMAGLLTTAEEIGRLSPEHVEKLMRISKGAQDKKHGGGLMEIFLQER